MPSLTVALPEAGAGGPAVQVVMTLWIPNSIPAPARTAREVRQVRMTSAGEAPFNALVEGVLRWAIGAIRRSDASVIAADELAAIAEYLADPSRRASVYTYARLTEFLGLNYDVQVGTPLAGPTGPTGPASPLALDRADRRPWGRWSRWCGAAATSSISDVLGEDGPVGLSGLTRTAPAPAARFLSAGLTGATGASGPEDSGTIFPMIPDFTMAPQGLRPTDFAKYNLVGPAYEALLDQLFGELGLDARQGVTGRPSAAVTADAAGAGPTGQVESLATFVFRDYFGLIGKAAVQSAIELLKRYPYAPRATDTLNSIASQFDKVAFAYRARPGETLGSVAMGFGMSVDDLVEANPGLRGLDPRAPLPPGELVVAQGVTPASIAHANQDASLANGPDPARLTISGVSYQVKAGDTLAGIASQFGLPGPTSLFDPASVTANADNNALFRPGATFVIPQGFYYTVDANDQLGDEVLLRVAAFFLVRLAGPPTAGSFPDLPWYTQQIVDLNENTGINFNDLSGDAGQSITIPVAQAMKTGLQSVGTTSYTIRPADTLDFIGALFEMVQLDPSAASKLVTDLQNLNRVSIGVGTHLVIPQLSRTVLPTDSLGYLATLFGATPDDLLASPSNVNNANLLSPLSVLRLPTLSYPIAAGDTLSRVAARFDLSLDLLTESVRGCTGIFPVGGDPLVIPDVPRIGVDELVGELIDGGGFNAISAMASRYLLHGLRIPSPTGPSSLLAAGPGMTGGTDFRGLYGLIGQQFAAPTGPTAAASYPVRFTKGPSASWVTFASTDPASLSVVITAKTFAEQSPSPILDPQLIAGPTASPMFAESAPRYGLETSIHWQAAKDPVLPAGPTGMTGSSGATGSTGLVTGSAGQPSIWLFPDTLSGQMGGLAGPTGATRPYELLQAAPTPSDPSATQRLEQYSWATAVPLQVLPAPVNTPGSSLPNGYLLVGTDQSGQDLLLQLWTYLEASGQPQGARLYILYRPGADSASPKGLASDTLAAAGTFVLKTNLSTVTHPGPDIVASRELLRLGPGGGDYSARIDSAAAFLKFVWEGSVTNSGGFYLSYTNAAGGGGLPASVFASSGSASLWLVSILDEQSGGMPDRRLYPFNNCAVVGENVGVAASSLFARLSDPVAGERVRVATSAPGTVGFQLSRRNPDFGMTAGSPISPVDRTRSLFNLVGYQLQENAYFRGSPEGLPAGPLGSDGGDASRGRSSRGHDRLVDLELSAGRARRPVRPPQRGAGMHRTSGPGIQPLRRDHGADRPRPAAEPGRHRARLPGRLRQPDILDQSPGNGHRPGRLYRPGDRPGCLARDILGLRLLGSSRRASRSARRAGPAPGGPVSPRPGAGHRHRAPERFGRCRALPEDLLSSGPARFPGVLDHQPRYVERRRRPHVPTARPRHGGIRLPRRRGTARAGLGHRLGPGHALGRGHHVLGRAGRAGVGQRLSTRRRPLRQSARGPQDLRLPSGRFAGLDGRAGRDREPRGPNLPAAGRPDRRQRPRRVRPRRRRPTSGGGPRRPLEAPGRPGPSAPPAWARPRRP